MAWRAGGPATGQRPGSVRWSRPLRPSALGAVCGGASDGGGGRGLGRSGRSPGGWGEGLGGLGRWGRRPPLSPRPRPGWPGPGALRYAGRRAGGGRARDFGDGRARVRRCPPASGRWCAVPGLGPRRTRRKGRRRRRGSPACPRGRVEAADVGRGGVWAAVAVPDAAVEALDRPGQRGAVEGSGWGLFPVPCPPHSKSPPSGHGLAVARRLRSPFAPTHVEAGRRRTAHPLTQSHAAQQCAGAPPPFSESNALWPSSSRSCFRNFSVCCVALARGEGGTSPGLLLSRGGLGRRRAGRVRVRVRPEMPASVVDRLPPLVPSAPATSPSTAPGPPQWDAISTSRWCRGEPRSPPK